MPRSTRRSSSRRRNRAVAAAILILLAVAVTPATPAAAACTQPLVTSAAELTQTYDLFGAYAAGAGFRWLGGDGSIPVRLPSGATAWLFGDSLVKDASGGTHFVNNVIVVQNGSTLSTVAGGTPQAPTTLLRPATAGHWYWPSAGFVEGGRLKVVVQEFEPVTGGWRWLGNAIIVLDATTFARLATQDARGSTGLPWGMAVVQDGTRTYLYAQEEVLRPDGFRDYFWRVARFPIGGSAGSWEFWSTVGGAGAWSSQSGATRRLTDAAGTAVSAQLGSVVRYGSGYLALSINPLNPTTIDGYFACAPQGPWSARQVLFSIPQHPGERYYLARAYADGTNRLLIAYSVADGRPRYARLSYA